MNDKCPDVINANELRSIIDYESKVKGICEVLTRDHMKVAFFGRFVIFVKYGTKICEVSILLIKKIIYYKNVYISLIIF